MCCLSDTCYLSSGQVVKLFILFIFSGLIFFLIPQQQLGQATTQPLIPLLDHRRMGGVISKLLLLIPTTSVCKHYC